MGELNSDAMLADRTLTRNRENRFSRQYAVASFPASICQIAINMIELMNVNRYQRPSDEVQAALDYMESQILNQMREKLGIDYLAMMQPPKTHASGCGTQYRGCAPDCTFHDE